MSDTHRTTRPQWTCTDDGTAWPCPTARQRLTEAYGERTDLLRTHLARLLPVAASDLGLAEPARLYRRFVGWLPGPDGPCQRCGSTTHVYLACLPPRFTPCAPARLHR